MKAKWPAPAPARRGLSSLPDRRALFGEGARALALVLARVKRRDRRKAALHDARDGVLEGTRLGIAQHLLDCREHEGRSLGEKIGELMRPCHEGCGGYDFVDETPSRGLGHF